MARRSQPSVCSLPWTQTLAGPALAPHTHLASLPHTAASRCPKGESPSLLAAWALGHAPTRDQDRPPGVLKALNQRSALQGWAVAPPSQYGKHRWVAANSWPFSLVLLPPARREDPTAVQGSGAQVGVLRPWGAAHLLWEARGAGLPHRWPPSSLSSYPHPAGSREQAEGQPATDTALQRTKTRRGWGKEGTPLGGGQGAEQGTCSRGRQRQPRGGSSPPCPRQAPRSVQKRAIALSMSLSLSLSLPLTGKDLLEKFDKGLPGSSTRAHFSL